MVLNTRRGEEIVQRTVTLGRLPTDVPNTLPPAREPVAPAADRKLGIAALDAFEGKRKVKANVVALFGRHLRNASGVETTAAGDLPVIQSVLGAEIQADSFVDVSDSSAVVGNMARLY